MYLILIYFAIFNNYEIGNTLFEFDERERQK